MRRLWLVFSQAVTVALAVVFVLATLKPQWIASPAGGAPVQLNISQAPAAVAAGASSSPGSFAPAARRASPSVVSVVTSVAVDPKRKGNPAEPWFHRYFGDQEGPTSGTGSAVIVSADGYLLTNNHVVENAGQIEIGLADGRRVAAKVVGTDPDSDLAVLKVALDGLPAITFGDADGLQVGDVVLAIGNPFNVGQTVTSGIVSAVGRTGLGLNTFENFIQTDAAINPGNSGGALVDATGQLLGINTAIYSRSGGSMGIGFAIPVSTARQVMEGLITEGVVMRGWIGVQPSDLTADMAESFKLKVDHGVLITGVLQGGPASAAGMQPGDVVLKVGAVPVGSTAQLLNAVAALKPQSPAVITVQRGEQALDLTVKVAQRPKAKVASRKPAE
ncbi:trypsin-like peptidase domain-containing protein [Sphaerotilus montanus]|jgi:Do/DeqQ family serine protease|uniref:Do/DeqQ family serine protease n=1 Tax=Sphaerotilus montanus TaxID=522889 RepID=A0A7Y9R2F9_9BURK|nr:trypsin-like peptidase domain-containing protein [Sphaerotilus montanus]NYG33995.1 Do/DeqQ family serine protease [Sphaerotilus montanus]NZD55945.1 trypsin-like peptidase domain-containing protein [Sphaerotilus montanus]